MCIAYLALATHEQWPLIIAANRDEQHARPTRPTAPWPQNQRVIGGLDLQAGGTWFAVHQDGRFALLTNFRDMQPPSGQPTSRGFLCSDFLLATQMDAKTYIEHVASQGSHYQGFNLIVGQWQSSTGRFDCYYFSNRGAREPIALPPGHYVLSNHLLNTPWPKSERLLQNIQQQIQGQTPPIVDNLYEALRDEVKATDALLPETGLSLDKERLLSSPFIISPDYGTKSSSVWLVSQTGHSFLHECSYNSNGQENERHSWPLHLSR